MVNGKFVMAATQVYYLGQVMFLWLKI